MNIQGFSPTMAAPLMAQTAKPAAASGSSSAGTPLTSSSSLQETFLNLLVTELQNQDPTSPVDPTQMVSQMVSLNQLDQLISINQVLTNMSTDTGTPADSGSGQATAGTGQNAYSAAARTGAATSSSIPAAAAAFNQLPAAYGGAKNTTGLMNLYGSFGIPSTSLNSTFAGGR